MAGIDSNWVIVAARIGLIDRHIKRLALPGLFLGSQPCDERRTANDAPLAGLPLITRAGATPASRFAGSQVHAMGMPELVT